MKKRLAVFLIVVSIVMNTLCFVSAGDYIVPSGRIILTESFEDYTGGIPNGWSVWSAADDKTAYSMSTAKASDGERSLLITTDGEGKRGALVSPKIAVDEGGLYMASADVMVISGRWQLYLQYYDKDGVRIGVKTAGILNTGKWKTLTVAETAPEGVVYMSVLLYNVYGYPGTAYYDNVIIYNKITDEPTRDIPFVETGRPRLYFTQDELSELKEKMNSTDVNYAGLTLKGIGDNVIRLAERYLSETSFTVSELSVTKVTYSVPLVTSIYDLPDQVRIPPEDYEGSTYPYWSSLASSVRTRMETLSVAYALTGEEKYADKAKEYLLNLCKWEKWIEYNAPSLEVAYFTLGVSITYDVLYEKLTNDERLTVRESLKEKALELILPMSYMPSDDNGMLIRMSALVVGGLAVMGEEERAALYVSRGIDCLQWYLDQRLESGNHEGTNYMSYCLEQAMPTLEIFERVTGDGSLFEHKFLCDVLFKWVVASGDNTNIIYAPISDVLLNTSTGFFRTASILAKRGNAYAGYFLKKTKVSSKALDGLLYTLTDDFDAYTPSHDMYSYYIGEVGWLVLRSSWEIDKPMLVFTSSQSDTGHNHYDTNSFFITQNGETLLVDPGYGAFKGDGILYGDAYGHNTMYVDGGAQSVKGGGSLKNVLSSPLLGYGIGSGADSYELGLVDRFDRHMIMVNYNTPYYVLIDDVSCSEVHDLSFRFNFDYSKSLEANGEALSLGSSIVSKSFVATSEKGTELYLNFAKEHTFSYGDYKGAFGKLLDLNVDNTKNASVLGVISVDENVSIEKDISKDGLLGAVVSHENGKDKFAVSLSGRTQATVDGLEFYGSSAFVFGTDSSLLVGYALTDGTSLAHGGRKLFESDAPVSLSFSPNSAVPSTISVEGSSPVSVRLFIGNKIVTSFKVDSEDQVYTVENGYLYTTFTSGEHSFDVKTSSKPTVKESTYVDVSLGGGTVTYESEGKSGTWRSSVEKYGFGYGKEITLTATANSGYRFVHWRDAKTGRVVSESETYSFILGSDVSLTAFFVGESSKYVIFVDRMGKVVKASGVVFGSITAPEKLTAYQGFVFTGWDKSFDNVQGLVIVNALYTKNDTLYDISVTGGYINGDRSVQTGQYLFDTRITITAAVPKGKYFAGWSCDGGKTVVSYKEKYSFNVGSSSSFTALVSDTEVQEKPVIAITGTSRSVIEDGEKQQAVFLSNWTVPSGYRIVEAGYIRTVNEGYKDSLTLDNVDGTSVKITTSTKKTSSGQYILTVNLSNPLTKTVYIRPYLTYIEDSTGSVVTVYGNTVISEPVQ